MSTSSTNQGATIWLTGLSGAGKSTIAEALIVRLREAGHRVDILDGDEVRQVLTADLGFSREDRFTNVQRIGFVAELLASHGVQVLVPVIAPYADSREAVRKRTPPTAPPSSRSTWPPRSRSARSATSRASTPSRRRARFPV